MFFILMIESFSKKRKVKKIAVQKVLKYRCGVWYIFCDVQKPQFNLSIGE